MSLDLHLELMFMPSLNGGSGICLFCMFVSFFKIADFMKWDPSATEDQIKGAAELEKVVPTSESVLKMHLLQALAFKFYFLTGFCLFLLFF